MTSPLIDPRGGSDGNRTGSKRLLTIAEACEFLWNRQDRTAKARLYRAIADGRVESTRWSGRHWLRLADLKAIAGE